MTVRTRVQNECFHAMNHLVLRLSLIINTWAEGYERWNTLSIAQPEPLPDHDGRFATLLDVVNGETRSLGRRHSCREHE